MSKKVQALTTPAAAPTAGDATFADVGETTTAAASPQGKPTDTADKAKVTYLRVFVLAMTAAGNPEFFTAIVGATAEEIAEKKHLEKAQRKASVEGYRWPMKSFDQNSAAARQLDVLAGRQADAMSRA
ncbi:hypothetical protein [Paraburkholderia phenazinium]|nr:hypothetical protein [Paraburkholderia phenazinium]